MEQKHFIYMDFLKAQWGIYGHIAKVIDICVVISHEAKKNKIK